MESLKRRSARCKLSKTSKKTIDKREKEREKRGKEKKNKVLEDSDEERDGNYEETSSKDKSCEDDSDRDDDGKEITLKAGMTKQVTVTRKDRKRNQRNQVITNEEDSDNEKESNKKEEDSDDNLNAKTKRLKPKGSPNEDDDDSEKNTEDKQIAIEINDITEKLSNSTIYCRDTEKESILAFITSQSPSQKTLFISGQPGTGKTSLVLDLFTSPPLQSKQYFIKLTINCMSLSSIQEFYNQIFTYLNTIQVYSHLKDFYPKSYEKLASLLKQSPSHKLLMSLLSLLTSSTVVILLDEIDFFYQKNSEMLFFDIINLPHLISGSMKMILISNNSDFDNEIFPKLTNRKIKTDKIVFKPYTPSDLTNIMRKKLEEIGMAQHFSADSIRFLSSKMNRTGDLRPIIEITKALILKHKEAFVSEGKKIELKDMFEVLKKKNIHLSEIIAAMTTEQKIAVVAICYSLKKGDVNLEEKDVYDKYMMIKKKTMSQQLSIEEFREVLKSFCENGLIEVKHLKAKSKAKGKGNNVYRVKYSEDDLEMIFTDSDMFRLFKKSNAKGEDDDAEESDMKKKAKHSESNGEDDE